MSDHRLLLGIGVGAMAIGVSIGIFLPVPTCPVGGASSACNNAGLILLVAPLVVVAGLVMAVLGAVRWWHSRQPMSTDESVSSDNATPLVDPGLTYLYQRRPPR